MLRLRTQPEGIPLIKPQDFERLTLELPRRATFIREGLPEPITDMLKGKTVERVLTTGQHLLIRFTDRTEARITWRDLRGDVLWGKPQLDEFGPHQ